MATAEATVPVRVPSPPDADQDLEEKHVGGHHSDKDEHGNTATTPGENEVAIAGTRVGLEPCLGLVKVFNPIEIEW